MGVPQIINFSGIFHYKQSIWEYHHLWKPPSTLEICVTGFTSRALFGIDYLIMRTRSHHGKKTSIMKHGDANPLNLMNGDIEKKRLQLFVVLECVKNASDGEKRIE